LLLAGFGWFRHWASSTIGFVRRFFWPVGGCCCPSFLRAIVVPSCSSPW
jgi:hypothetical protein